MKYFMIETNKIEINRKWKFQNQKYVDSLQRFMDKADLIQNSQLKNEIVYQMLECDRILTNSSENIFTKMFLKGYHKASISIKKQK